MRKETQCALLDATSSSAGAPESSCAAISFASLPRDVMGPTVIDVLQKVLVGAQLPLCVDRVHRAGVVHLAAAAADERVKVSRGDLSKLQQLEHVRQRHGCRQREPGDLGHL
jgi:hypothetical protein